MQLLPSADAEDNRQCSSRRLDESRAKDASPAVAQTPPSTRMTRDPAETNAKMGLPEIRSCLRVSCSVVGIPKLTAGACSSADEAEGADNAYAILRSRHFSHFILARLKGCGG